MKRSLLLMTLVLSFALAGLNRSAYAGTYEALSDTNRKIVSAIYESQLGSRRDLAGHPLLSKDQITAMRRQSSWEALFKRLEKKGYVAFENLEQAIRSYSQVFSAPSRHLIISTAAGEQIIVPRRSTAQRTPPDPARANILPTPRTVRPPIAVIELPVLTAEGTPARSAPPIEPTVSGLVAPGVAASAAQTR